jgi:hypothetical protein
VSRISGVLLLYIIEAAFSMVFCAYGMEMPGVLLLPSLESWTRETISTYTTPPFSVDPWYLYLYECVHRTISLLFQSVSPSLKTD